MSGSGARLLIGSLVGPAAAVNSVAFSPDGKTLAAGSADGTVRFWNVATQQSAGGSLIDRQARGVLSLAFSPDGKTVATGNTDGSVRLWDAATRRPIGVPFIADAGQVNSVAFSPDGKILASGSYDLTIRLWNVAAPTQNVTKTTDLVRYLCALAGRSLTRAEWAAYVPHLSYQTVCP